MATPDRYLPIDEEGYWVFDGRRVDDEELGRTLLKNIKPIENDRFVTSLQGQDAWVEAFDEPLIARHVRLASPGVGEIDLPYHSQALFSFSTLNVDEWDRFHGITSEQIPFVFSRQAQVEFFDMLDEFDDDSVTIQGQRYVVEPWLKPAAPVDMPQFWDEIYQTEENPPFDMGRETAILPAVLPQLKMSKSRVLVLGCGKGHDAAYFARQGHTVTAVDMSTEGLAQARKLYGDVEGLTFEQHDAFALPEAWNGRFDLIFEHTLYCAVDPSQRNALVQQWRRLLHPQGHVLAILFAFEKRTGPPWGGSEWELRERLKRGFDFLFWTRWHHSIEKRKAREVVAYLRKR
jgi:SAM-dependent methyltransferase